MKKLLLAVIILGALGVGAWFMSAKETAPVRIPPPVPVTVAQVTIQDMPLMLEIVGRAEAYETVILKSRVDGQVLAVPYTEGQHVREGEVLVRLDPADFNARLLQAEANLDRKSVV